MKYILSIIIIVANFSLMAQESPKASTMPFEKFSFMLGDWEGSGTSYSREGASRFTVKESLDMEMDSTIVVIKGIGKDTSGQISHHALGIVYFDPAKDGLAMHSFLSDGRQIIADVSFVGENAFNWWFEVPNGGKVIYEIKVVDERWIETGNYETPDGQRFPIVNMSLQRAQ